MLILMKLIKSTGGYDIGIGFESGPNGVLKDMRKSAATPLYEHILGSLFKHQFHLGPYIIFGFPTDSRDSVNETVNFIRHIRDFSDNFGIGMGWYLWGHIQRLGPSALSEYGINVLSISALATDPLSTSYTTVIPGMSASFTYSKGMNRGNMVVAWNKYYETARELCYDFFASESPSLNRM